MAADSPEFGQFSEKSRAGHVTDARNGFQERLGFAPSWGMLDGVADVVVDRVELLLEIGDVAREPSGERLVDGLAAPVGFHADHLDDLAPPTDEFGEVDPLRFPKRPCLWTHALGERGNHLRVERVGLGQAAHRAGEVSDLARVNDTERQPNAGQGRAATVASKPPVASSTTRATDSPWRRMTRSSIPLPSRGTQNASPDGLR